MYVLCVCLCGSMCVSMCMCMDWCVCVWLCVCVCMCVKDAAEWPGLSSSLSYCLPPEDCISDFRREFFKEKTSDWYPCPIQPSVLNFPAERWIKMSCFLAPKRDLAVVKSYVPISGLGKLCPLYVHAALVSISETCHISPFSPLDYSNFYC